MSEFEDAIQDQTIEQAPPTPPPEREIFTHVMEVQLDASEQLALKDQLVVVDNRIIDIEREKAKEMSSFNERLKDARKERVTLLEAIGSGKGRREIECYEERDDRLGRMLIRRVDTDETVDERPLSAKERDEDASPKDDRQTEMFDQGSGGGDEQDDHDTEPPPEIGDEDESEGGRIVRTTSAEVRAKHEGLAQEGDAPA